MLSRSWLHSLERKVLCWDNNPLRWRISKESITRTETDNSLRWRIFLNYKYMKQDKNKVLNNVLELAVKCYKKHHSNLHTENHFHLQRGSSSVIVVSQIESLTDFTVDWLDSDTDTCSNSGLLRGKKLGSWGTGRVIVLLVSIKMIVDNIGRSSGLSCTHKSAIWMHLVTSLLW